MTTAVKRKSAAPRKTTGLLDHLIPESRFAEEYISRKVEGVWDTHLLRYNREAGNNTLLSGPTGPGKTSLILAYAAADQLPLVTVQCNGAVDPDTFWGGLAFDDVGNLIGYQYSEISLVIKHGGVLYLDEVNFLAAKVAAVFHGALDKRRQITIPERGNELIKLHANTQIIAAYNPDYEGTKPLNAAFKNRFKVKIRFNYDEAVERELVYAPIMLELASKLRISHRSGDLDTPTSTNMLIEFEELAVDLGYEFAMNNFLNAFNDEERSSVMEAVDMYSDEIKTQVKKMEELSVSD